MSKSEQSDKLAQWLEGQLSDEEQRQFQQACSEDTDFAQRVATAARIEAMAQEPDSEPVPHWDIAATMGPQSQRESQNTPWWAWRGWSPVSMAMSCCAIALLSLQAEFKVEQGAVTLSFAQQPDVQAVQTQVTDAMQQYEQRQQQLLQQQRVQLQEQQLALNTQLTRYLLDTSRQERREDIVELIKFVNQQRDDDQLFYARQLNQLQEAIYEPEHLPE